MSGLGVEHGSLRALGGRRRRGTGHGLVQYGLPGASQPLAGARS
ncbi:hypothetical protein RR42_s0207 [Cupriavidus basilensis]|uniref:Uncharacterized protein n=1 Tax=Cupriavidus basilensis TaxID=68895 RepID=A0A0C4YGH6_9BURK|nr:hypothetical protein RR42_s0207 [Cupriavidus basilensis]